MRKGRKPVLRGNKRPKIKNTMRYILFAFLLLLLLPLLLIRLEKNQQFRQFAAGNVIYASPGDNLTQKAKSLAPGDTLILHDGTYTGSLDTSGVNGTAASPITIKAENDGKAVIDGQNAVPIVLSLMNSSYITVQGVVAKDATGSVVKTDGSNHLTLRRITASNAGVGNVECFSASNGASYITIEDSAGWGRCRYVFLAYHSSHITFRRDFAKWEQTDNFSPAPRSGFGAYGSTDILFENDIAYDIYPTSGVSDWFTGVWETTNGPQTQNITYLGCIFYHVLGDGVRVNDLQPFPGTVIKDSFFNNPVIPTISYPFTKGVGIDWVTPITGTISNNVFVGNGVGIAQGNGVPTVTNNIFLNNTTAISGNVQSSHNDFWHNTNTGITLSGSDTQVNPNFDTTTYGTGAYFFVPQSSPLSSAYVGANLIYEYENGVLTTKPLWPWPMEDRIKTEKGISVTYASGGGFWKTLAGVYPGTPPDTAVTPTPSLLVPSYVCGGSNTSICIPPTLTPTQMSAPTLPVVVTPGPSQRTPPQTSAAPSPCASTVAVTMAKSGTRQQKRSHVDGVTDAGSVSNGLVAQLLDLIKQLFNLVLLLLGQVPTQPIQTPCTTSASLLSPASHALSGPVAGQWQTNVLGRWL